MATATEIVAQLRQRPDLSPPVATGERVDRSVQRLVEVLSQLDGVVVVGEPSINMLPGETNIKGILRPRQVPSINVGTTRIVTAPDEPLYDFDAISAFLKYMTTAVAAQLPHLGMQSYKPSRDPYKVRIGRIEGSHIIGSARPGIIDLNIYDPEVMQEAGVTKDEISAYLQTRSPVSLTHGIVVPFYPDLRLAETAVQYRDAAAAGEIDSLADRRLWGLAVASFPYVEHGDWQRLVGGQWPFREVDDLPRLQPPTAS